MITDRYGHPEANGDQREEERGGKELTVNGLLPLYQRVSPSVRPLVSYQ